MRVNFNQLFQIKDGMISPKVPIQIGGVTMNPGVAFGRGVVFGGIELAQYVGHDFEVTVDNQQGVNIITHVY